MSARISKHSVCAKARSTPKTSIMYYYPQNEICFDGIKVNDETGEYEGCGGTVAEKIVLKGAIPSQFKYIGNCYAVSGNKMFHDGEVIEWDDSIANSIYNRHA